MRESRRFVIKSLLGQGGFGSVYLADMVSAGGFRKEVALKVLSSGVTTNPEAAIRLRDEARLLGLLRHRNIVAVDDLVRFDEGWGVVMEYVPGIDLGVFVTHLARSQQAFPLRAAVEVVRGIARALEAAYQHPTPDGEPLRAVHRDIKPGNVRITPEGEVKVLDFGIARAEFQAREAVTGDGRFGSLAYMSPERVLGDPEGPPGDIYALGIVLWECLAQKPRGRAKLRPSDHTDQVDEMLAGADMPAALAQLMVEMLAYEPEDRPSAADVGQRVRELLPTLPGDDLETLSRTVVPHAMAAGGTQPAPAIRELVPLTSANLDDTSTTDFGVGLPASFTAVPAVDDITGDSVAPAESSVPDAPPVPTSTARTWSVVVAVVVAVLVVLVGGAGAMSMLGTEPAARTPPAPTPPPVAAPSVATTPPPPEAAPEAVPEVTPPPEAAPPPEVTPPPEAPPPKPKAADPTPAPAKPAPDPTPPEAAPADAPRLRGVKFSATGASRIAATCSGTTGSGASSALVRDIPAGPCSIEATIDGQRHSGSVVVDSPRLYKCAVEAGALRCR